MLSNIITGTYVLKKINTCALRKVFMKTNCIFIIYLSYIF